MTERPIKDIVREALQRHGQPMSAYEIAATVGRDPHRIATALSALVTSGEATRSDGRIKRPGLDRLPVFIYGLKSRRGLEEVDRPQPGFIGRINAGSTPAAASSFSAFALPDFKKR